MSSSIRWMPQHWTDDKSTLVQVMACCHQATSHYLSQCWPRSISPRGITRPQCVNLSWFCHHWFSKRLAACFCQGEPNQIFCPLLDEKSGSSLYARQPHLASTYGSKNSLTPPHPTTLLDELNEIQVNMQIYFFQHLSWNFVSKHN